jgi:ABC-type antimicrobial peptide transport system permease subunit
LVRRLLAERDPRLAVFAIQTAADLVGQAAAARKLLLWAVTGFAIVGLIVSLIGLYGTVAYVVAQRTRELSVRLALGATTAQIRGMVMTRGLRLVAGGVAVGVVGAFVLRPAIEAQLFGITALNVPALATAAFALLVAAAAACLPPAARATRVNPVDALKAE